MVVIKVCKYCYQEDALIFQIVSQQRIEEPTLCVCVCTCTSICVYIGLCAHVHILVCGGQKLMLYVFLMVFYNFFGARVSQGTWNSLMV